MNNRKKYSDRTYNDRWDEHADRDRYERDYYQNRSQRPQGYSYDNDRDMSGSVDYDRYGTGYTGNNYDRMGSSNDYEKGFSNDQYGSSDYNRRHSDRSGGINYGYSENRNKGYGKRSEGYGTGSYGDSYGSAGRSYGNRGGDWNMSDNQMNEERRNYGNYGFREPGYRSSGTGSNNYNNRPGNSYRGRTSGDYERYAPFRDEDRNWWDRTSDEVASWFGDDDAERRRQMDQTEDRYNDRHQSNDHRGKGVKGYQRSDEKIKSDLEDELYHDSYIDASDMTVSVTNAVVTLSGSVDSKWTKRRAEDMAETVTGVKDVVNNITVRKEVGYNKSESQNNITTNTSHKTGSENSQAKNKKTSEV